MPFVWIREFARLEAAGGIVLMLAAAAALVIANSPLGHYYLDLLEIPFSIQLGTLGLSKPILLWVNDAWMAVFFFLVGLEIKREVLEGRLSSRSDLLLPAAAAIGGMAMPAIIYVAINWQSAINMNGWAIPTATDIAFALGILGLLGSRAPMSLKVLLTAIAIIDDLGAIVIIALFYTDGLSLMSLGLAVIPLIGLIVLNRMRVSHATPYVLLGAVLWVFVLKSGVHATLAGVVTAFAIPLGVKDEDGHSLLEYLEHKLHPWVAFLILPVFAFANAGVPLAGLSLDTLLHPLSLGVAAGLFVGKQLGVFGAVWLAVKAGLAVRPDALSWRKLYGAACLAGIGFTMSLFVGSLAFEDVESQNAVRLGVLSGSILSGLLGAVVLSYSRVVRPARIEV